ncbi:MAG: hypothetical protein IPG46_16135 [Actinobacteria bacterium]|nr:hypothetical protein [Actinomycetota bacterium]
MSRQRDVRAGQAAIDQTIQILNDWDVGGATEVGYPVKVAQRKVCQNRFPVTADPARLELLLLHDRPASRARVCVPLRDGRSDPTLRA